MGALISGLAKRAARLYHEGAKRTKNTKQKFFATFVLS
jgi:hypothetical protein